MNKRITIASALKIIASGTRDQGLDCETMQKFPRETAYLQRKLHLTKMQCYIVAVMLDNAGDPVSPDDLADHAEASRIFILGLQNEMDMLVDRGVINVVGGGRHDVWNMHYMPSESLVQAVSHNHELRPEVMSDLTSEEMWERITNLLHACDFDNLSYPLMLGKMKTMMSECQHLDFCKKIISLNLNDADMIMLLIVCNALVNKEDDYVTTFDYNKILPHSSCSMIVKQFRDKTSDLVVKDILENVDNDEEDFRLTVHGILLLLGEEYVPEDRKEPKQTPAPPNKQTIVPKNMFYNEDERKHILRLEALLCQDSFVSIQQRMKEAGLRTGFCCLFYGAPGTGKTETVLQIARRTGRDIIRVDLSSQKSMWVGESEKNIERIFADYREKLSQSELAPILLFNEADAIFSKRHVGVNSEVEQMANTMQNILLQNMENFEGILIATTNLADNFDPAFHRRFLYRIEFKSPSAEVRKQIWRSMMPDMDESNIKAMAERFSISGGQIENAVRKMMIESILKGCPLNTDEVIAICEDEVQKKRVSLKKLCV